MPGGLIGALIWLLVAVLVIGGLKYVFDQYNFPPQPTRNVALMILGLIFFIVVLFKFLPFLTGAL